MIKASEELIPYFEKAGQTQKLLKDEILYIQGDDSSNIYLIAKGRVRLYFIGSDGNQITYRIMGERQLIGESAFLGMVSRPVTVRAVNNVTLISCKVDALLPFLQRSPELIRAVLSLLTDNYNALCSHICRLSIYNSTQRIASYLVDHTTQDERGIGVHNGILPYTHAELGGCLNLNRVTVTRILHDFEEKQLVRLGRKQIQVIDPEGLRQIVLQRHS